MQETGINLIFITIGEPEKLAVFLEANPSALPELFLVDDYTFGAYEALGYGKIGDDKEKSKQGAKKMKKPELDWWKYATSVGKISPIPKGMKFGEIPEGVLRLGGTVGINGNKIVYSYEDGVPGDYPAPADVLQSFA